MKFTSLHLTHNLQYGVHDRVAGLIFQPLPLSHQNAEPSQMLYPRALAVASADSKTISLTNRNAVVREIAVPDNDRNFRDHFGQCVGEALSGTVEG